jgi:hypothetical protein
VVVIGTAGGALDVVQLTPLSTDGSISGGSTVRPKSEHFRHNAATVAAPLVMDEGGRYDMLEGGRYDMLEGASHPREMEPESLLASRMQCCP